MPGKPETELQSAIVKALRQMGVWVMVMNVTKRRGLRGVNCGEPGMPDLWTELGWLEVKMPGEDMDPDQVAWHLRAKRRGVQVGIAWSVRDALELVRAWETC